MFHSGDFVVYRKTKHNTRPSRRAVAVSPAPNGETYTYQVDKFWIVDAVQCDGSLLLRSRRGKTHVLDAHDSNLRLATFWERFAYADRFLHLGSSLPAGEFTPTSTIGSCSQTTEFRLDNYEYSTSDTHRFARILRWLNERQRMTGTGGSDDVRRR
jgi:hypothetical protein